MGARQQLNSVYVLIALVIAAVIGAVAQSWVVFAVAAAVLIGSLVNSADIRIMPTRRPPSRKRR